MDNDIAMGDKSDSNDKNDELFNVNKEKDKMIKKILKRNDGKPKKVIEKQLIHDWRLKKSRMKQLQIRQAIADGKVLRENLLECKAAQKYRGGKTYVYQNHNYNYVCSYKKHATIKCTRGVKYIYFYFYFFFCFFLVLLIGFFLDVFCAELQECIPYKVYLRNKKVKN